MTVNDYSSYPIIFNFGKLIYNRVNDKEKDDIQEIRLNITGDYKD